MRKYLLLFALLTIVLAACRVESNVTLDIAEDGSATVGAEIGFDEEFKQLIEQSGASTDDIFGDLPSFGGNEVQTTERTDGDMSFYGVVTQVDDLSDFDMSSAQGDVFSSFSYTFDDASASLDATLSSADLGDVGGELPIDPSQITDEFFSANVIVKMPGNVTESNADEVRSDGSLVWNIPFTGTKQITATSDFGSSSANWILPILIAVLVIGIIAAVVATIVSRRESQKAVEAAAASHQASVAAAAAPATQELPSVSDDADASPSDGGSDVTDGAEEPEESDGASAHDDATSADAAPMPSTSEPTDRTIEVELDDEPPAPAVGDTAGDGDQPDRT